MAYYLDPLEMPTALPAYFPAELQPQAHKVFAETRRKFPVKLYVMDAVRFVTRKMTPHFSASVKAGSIFAASALSQMGQLVDSILDYNSGTLPAQERRRREQEARASKEWASFQAAINRAERKRQRSPGDRQRRQEEEIAEIEAETAREWRSFARAGGQGGKGMPASAQGPEIAKRRTIIRQNPSLNASGLCLLFDNLGVPLPKSMSDAGGWVKAYRASQYRPRIDTIISKDRKA